MFATLGKSILTVAVTGFGAMLGVSLASDVYEGGKIGVSKAGGAIGNLFKKKEEAPVVITTRKARTAKRPSPAAVPTRRRQAA